MELQVILIVCVCLHVCIHVRFAVFSKSSIMDINYICDNKKVTKITEQILKMKSHFRDNSNESIASSEQINSRSHIPSFLIYFDLFHEEQSFTINSTSGLTS